MNQSRWCVTAVFALGALACSDPVPPPGQGAFTVSVTAAGNCPTGPAYTFEVPAVANFNDKLSTSRYVEKIIDGESGSVAECRVKGTSTLSFSGKLRKGTQVLEVSGGSMGADFKGTAAMSVYDGTRGLSVSSAAGACTVEAVVAGTPPTKAGSIYASFNCPLLESPPSDRCAARGVFVFQNCEE